MVHRIETAARLCYNSKAKIELTDKEIFIKKLIKNGHCSPLEHAIIQVELTTSRYIATCLLRHRIGSYTSESTQYIQYNQMTVIKPLYVEKDKDNAFIWEEQMKRSEDIYKILINLGVKHSEARGVLPLDLACKYIVTYNIRQWRHVLKLRLGNGETDEMFRVMDDIFIKFFKYYPVFFEDLRK